MIANFRDKRPLNNLSPGKAAISRIVNTAVQLILVPSVSDISTRNHDSRGIRDGIEAGKRIRCPIVEVERATVLDTTIGRRTIAELARCLDGVPEATRGIRDQGLDPRS